ncbi:MAG: hypothetical protein Q9167_005872 [Letrouitia subvulpina]
MCELVSSADVDLHFLDGPIECEPEASVAEQFDGPYRRFLARDAAHSNDHWRLDSVQPVMLTTSPEHVAREMRARNAAPIQISRACDYVQDHLDRHTQQPFDGVLGFSEGASVAASLILHQADQRKEPFKFAIFICGLSATTYAEERLVLSDETSLRIRIPTAHVLGAKDPVRQLSLTLFNLCDPSLATMFDHGKGHTIPWGAATEKMATEIRQVIRRSQL